MEELRELWSTIKVFILPILIVILLLFYNENKTEKKNKSQGKRNKKSSDEFEENLNDYFGTGDKKYEDEWNYDQQELNSLQIKIEKQQVESLKVFDVMAFGMLGFTKDQIDQTKLEKEEAKFTCYVFDITDAEKTYDKDHEIPLQGLTDPYKDENYLLSSTRNMKVGIGFAYNEWTPMFRFPVHLVVPPYRGKRKIKFIVSATKKMQNFEKG